MRVKVFKFNPSEEREYFIFNHISTSTNSRNGLSITRKSYTRLICVHD